MRADDVGKASAAAGNPTGADKAARTAARSPARRPAAPGSTSCQMWRRRFER